MTEDLATMGHPPSEDESYVIILGSLPPSYEPFISAMNTMSSVLGTFLSSDDLMQALTDEYDCQVSENPPKERRMLLSMLEEAVEEVARRSPENVTTVANLATGQGTVGKMAAERKAKDPIKGARKVRKEKTTKSREAAKEKTGQA
jgi:hypothetical protein